MLNLIQNLDLNLNTYVILGLGFTLFSFTTYCFITKSVPLGYKTIYFNENSLTDNNLDSESTESIISNDTVTQNLTQKTQITDRIDEVIGLLKAEGPNLYHLSDDALKDRILNILYGMCSDTDELTEVPTISNSVFNALIFYS